MLSMSISRLWTAVKWYVKGLFIHPLVEILLVIILIGEYLSLANYKHLLAFAFLSEYILFPMYGIYVGLHFTREHRIFVFEINLFKNLNIISMARFIASVIGFIPLLMISISLLVYFDKTSLIVPVSVKILFFIIVTLVASLFNSKSFSFMFIILMEMLIPLSNNVIIQSLLPGQKLDIILSSLMYLTSTLSIYVSRELSVLSPSTGFLVAILICLSSLLVYNILLKRIEYSP